MSSNDPPELLEVGRIVRVHGLRGEVVVDLTSNVEERLAKGAQLFTDPDGASSITIVSAKPHQGRWLVRLDGVGDRNAAEAVGRPRLYGAPVDDPYSSQLLAAPRRLFLGRLPMTIFYVYGAGSEAQLEEIEQRELDWLLESWRSYRSICFPDGDAG